MSRILFGAMLELGDLMKPLMQFGLCCLLAPALFAGRQGGGAVAGAHAGGGHAGGVTSSHNAVHPHGSIRTGYGRRGYGYGGFYGDYYDPFYDSGYYPAADPGGPNLADAPSAPAVTIVETAHSVIHEYTQPEDYGSPSERASHPAGQPNYPLLYLIAFRDSSIHAAMTYWVEGGSLYYLDSDHKEKQAPLASVDRDLSAKLNSERHVPFNLQ